MSTLKIWETVQSSGMPVVRLDSRVNYQTVTFTATPGQSTAFDSDTTIIAVSADVACAVRAGPASSNPTAVITDYPVLANTITHFGVNPGDKLSVIAT